MTRLAIVVEGPTEREFVRDILADYLLTRQVYTVPLLLNGNVTVTRLASEMAKLIRSFDCVSSLVDFYGFRDKGNATLDELEHCIGEKVNAQINLLEDKTRVIPYVQKHEFEGLLFSNVDAFSDVTTASQRQINELRNIRSRFSTPEDINDSYNTAPSKRIAQIIPRYQKVAHGPLIAQSAGFDTIRAECPRFSAWVARLESLGNCPPQSE